MEGILVIGTPGSGKSTFSMSLSKLLTSMDRQVVLVNIDPANELNNEDYDIDVRDLISTRDVMDSLDLGPNGSLLYCMDFLQANIKWLSSRIKARKGGLFILDCPGQIEIYTQHDSLREITKGIAAACEMLFCVVNLVDSVSMVSPSVFISACLASLAMMTHLELPHINCLSKIDLLQMLQPSMRLPLSFYTEGTNLSELINHEDLGSNQKLVNLSTKLCGVLDDFGLVSFTPISSHDSSLLLNLCSQLDRTFGRSTVPTRESESLLEYIEEAYLPN